MIFWELYAAFFQIGLLSFGGGYAALPLIQARIVQLHGWLTMTEFTDVVTISQMTPGPIGINAATFVGIRVAGLWGAVAATTGCVTPSIFIVLTLAWVYKKYNKQTIIRGVLEYLRPAVIGLIAASGLSIVVHAIWAGNAPSLGISAVDLPVALLLAAGLVVLRIWKLNPIYVMMGAGALGLIGHWTGILT